MRSRARLLVLGVSVLYPAPVLAGSDEDVNAPEIEATLRGSIHAVRGAEWPRSRITGESQDIAGEADLSKFTLHLPDGRSLTTLTTTIFMIQDDGRINYASVTPQPQLFDFRFAKLVDFRQAVRKPSESRKISKFTTVPRSASSLSLGSVRIGTQEHSSRIIALR